MMQVPIFRLEYDDRFIRRYQEGCADILRSDRLAEGNYVRRFEYEFAEFIGTEHAIAVGSGTDALEVALRAIGVQGKDVIIPTNTFIATALAAKRAGGNIKLVDIEADTFALAPEQLAHIITPETGAVIIVHIGGLISKYIRDIVQLCRMCDVPLLEDAAHAHGACSGNLVAGAIGIAGCFSFFPTKVMTTGEGGMITTNDDRIAALARSIKDFGRMGGSPVFRCDGLNARMTEFQGLMGVLEMGRVIDRATERQVLAEQYQSNLAGTVFEAVGNEGDSHSAYYKQIVKISGMRMFLHKYCKSRGVELTGEVYRWPLHRQPTLGLPGHFPVADWFSKHHICPPLYPELTFADVDYVCDVLKKAEVLFD